MHVTESEALPTGPDNPYGLALVPARTPLRTEHEGMQDYDWGTQRAWKVVNEQRAQRARHARSATSSSRAAAFPRCSIPTRRWSAAPG